MAKNLYFTIRLDPPTREALDRLAVQTDRTRGSVIRSLLALSEIPEIKNRLGTPRPNHKTETTNVT